MSTKPEAIHFSVASALPFHLAFAGIPVVDGVNLSQTTVSAIQNVAAVTKQIEQYKTQLQQYQIMLRNSAAPADYIWSQADQTISMLLAAQDTLSYYKTQAGSLEKYLERYQDTAHYESAPCIGSDACGVSDQLAIAQAQKEASSTKKRANDALLTSVSKQQQASQSKALKRHFYLQPNRQRVSSLFTKECTRLDVVLHVGAQQ
ncbi:hypothetical protein [Pseudomonas putida]|uniref:hypothetical protein n=1 Tax=Pseudomonas putida TaxID=303 RepID=UPI001E5C8CBD|nr:hypothetical protein [Pseudomonas putida]